MARGVSDVPPSLHRWLGRYVRRRRRVAAGRALAVVVTGFTGFALVMCVVDRLGALPASARVVALGAGIGAAIACVARPVGRLLRRQFDAVAAAAAVEAVQPAFDGRLVTVVSQFARSPVDRGSAALLGDVAREVEQQVARGGRPPVSTRPLLWPCVTLVAVLSLAAGLARWPWLDLPQLARRFAMPMASVDPVTATHLTVRPGLATVIEGRPLTITANVTGAGVATVVLHVSDDGQTWADRTMSPDAASAVHFTDTLTSTDRDLRYTVTAGDATSPTYAVQVLHVPAMVELRVRYDAPGGGRRTTAASDDGVLEGVVGTVATVDVVATEPLRRATFRFGRTMVATTPTADPCVREASLTLRRDERYDLRLTAVTGMIGHGPPTTAVRVRPAASGADAGDAPPAPGYAERLRGYFQTFGRANNRRRDAARPTTAPTTQPGDLRPGAARR